MLKKIRYHSEIGSYRGCVKVGRNWISVKNLNVIDKTGWLRHQGPATQAMELAMREKPIEAAQIVSLC